MNSARRNSTPRSSTLKHTLVAHLILLTGAWLLFTFLVQPLWMDWQSARQQTLELQDALDVRQQQNNGSLKINTAFEQKLAALALSGDIIIATPEQAAHDFQTAVKSTLQEHGAKVKRLIPNRSEIQPGLFKITLELTFQAQPEAIQLLLDDLAKTQSKAQVELLSLRQTVFSSAQSNGTVQGFVLEGRLIATTLSTQASSATLDTKVVQPITKIEHGIKPERVVGPNRLASLFDPSIRSKFMSPEIKDYRVAAITVTEQSQTAVIIDVDSGKTYRLKQGDFLHAWKVVNIEPAKVSLLAGNVSGELRLN